MAEKDDEEERVTDIGLFNVAETYWRAAQGLETLKLKSTHRDSPIYFLYYHAIELYLKAFLRHHGHTPKELRSKKFGHKTCCLVGRAAELKLVFDEEDHDVFSLMITTDAILRSWYIQT